MRRTLAAGLALLISASACSTGSDDAGDGSEKTALDSDRIAALRLTRNVPARVDEACAEAEAFAAVRVVCPRLVPAVPLATIAGTGGAVVVDAEPRFYVLDFNTTGEGGVDHWITGGGDAAVVRKWVLTDFANEVKGNPVHVRSVRIDEYKVAVYRFPPPGGGMHAGHWAAFVTAEDYVVFASLHGRRYEEAAVEMALDLARVAEATRG